MIMSRDQHMHITSCIPYELIINILSRLPSKFLLRFRCVCKSWCSLISHDPYFRTLHLHNANNSNNNALAHWLCIHSEGRLRLHSYQIFDKTFSYGKPELCHEHERHWLLQVIGSCNGLIFVYHRHDTRTYSTKYTLSLWNPSTRTHKTLKVLSVRNVPTSYYSTLFGVGFSNKDNDYKVVFFSRNWKDKQDLLVYLYSLSNNSWSELQVAEPDSSWRDWHTPTCFRGGTYFNGAFHWTCTIQHKGQILCFDFDHKSIRLMDVPPLPPRYRGYAIRKSFLHKHMLAYWDIGLDDNSEYRFWVMKEYGNSNSWTSLFRVEKEKLLCSNHTLNLFGTTIDGKLFLYKSYEGGSDILMAYDPETKESKKLQATNVFTLIPYQENLLMLL